MKLNTKMTIPNSKLQLENFKENIIRREDFLVYIFLLTYD